MQNDLLGVVIKYVVVRFLRKKNLCFDRNLLCFVSLYLPRPCLVLVAYNKKIFHVFFLCLISKLFTLGNTIPNFTFRRKGKEYLLIINLPFRNGYLPEESKMAEVFPIFKKDDSLVKENYRPVTIFSHISKFVERLM